MKLQWQAAGLAVQDHGIDLCVDADNHDDERRSAPFTFDEACGYLDRIAPPSTTGTSRP